MIHICGVAKGRTKAMRCPCCGIESDNPEAFATSACWACAFGMNLDCRRCRDLGVWVDRFSSKSGKGHRFARWTRGGHYAITACGYRIPRKDIGGATAVRQECLRCWPEPDDDGSTGEVPR